MKPFVVYFFWLIFLISLRPLSAQQADAGYTCKVSIDLVNVSKDKDRVHVTITTPPLRGRHVRYIMPAYLPGIGNKVDAGQFLHQFYALDDRGLPIKVAKRGRGNVVLLKLGKGRTLRKIDYWVDDTWDVDGEGHDYHDGDYNFVPNAAGTMFESGDRFLLNTAFMLGYFEGYAWMPYHLTITHDDALTAFTAMKSSADDKDRDEYFATSYSDLTEYPIYYGAADTCGFLSDNVYIDIAVYSATGSVTARQVRRYIGAEVAASTKFLGNITPQHYKMLFYLVPPGDSKLSQGVFGSTAHRSSSVYYLQESADEDQLINTIVRESAGDVLKMLPLLDVTRQGYPLDFSRPVVPCNWWIAEGMKSYFKWISELRDSVVSEDEYMAAVSAKIRLYDHIKTKSLTATDEVGKAMRDPLVAEEYKAKAMLAVFLLDINTTLLTGGEKGLREIVLELNDSAGFRPDSIGKYLARKVSPELLDFITKYVRGNSTLPLIGSFDKIGWVYSPVALDSMLTFGQISMYYDETSDAFFVREADAGNRLTLQAGDRLVSINGIHIDAANLDEALALIYSPQSTDAVEVIFIRGNQNERVMAVPYFRTLVIEHIVRTDPASGTDAQLLHNRIFSPADY